MSSKCVNCSLVMSSGPGALLFSCLQSSVLAQWAWIRSCSSWCLLVAPRLGCAFLFACVLVLPIVRSLGSPRWLGFTPYCTLFPWRSSNLEWLGMNGCRLNLRYAHPSFVPCSSLNLCSTNVLSFRAFLLYTFSEYEFLLQVLLISGLLLLSAPRFHLLYTIS